MNERAKSMAVVARLGRSLLLDRRELTKLLARYCTDQEIRETLDETFALNGEALHQLMIGLMESMAEAMLSVAEDDKGEQKTNDQQTNAKNG